MWWLLFPLGILLYLKLNDLVALYKGKDVDQQKEQEMFLEEQLELLEQLKELVGYDCLMTSISFAYMSYPTTNLPVKIIEVDTDWVKVRTLKKKKEVVLILAITDIISISKII